jgi:hypothetical protein
MKSREKRLGNNATKRKDDQLHPESRAIGNQRPAGDIQRLQEDLCKKEHSGNQVLRLISLAIRGCEIDG